MWPVSSRFLSTLRQSHTAVAYCDLWRKREVVASDLPMIGGTINDDSTAVIRRTCDINFVPTDDVLALLPPDVPDRGGLWPVGNELHIRAGIRYGPEDEELVPMGVFRVAKSSLSESEGQIAVQVSGFDRSRTVSRARFTKPYIAGWPTWSNGVVTWQNLAACLKTLITSRMPWLDPVNDFRMMTTAYTAPLIVYTMDDDPMEKAIDMAAAFGAEVFFDGNGVCVLRPEPNPVFDLPVFRYEEGTDAVLKEVSRKLDDDQAYNGVIATSQSSSIWTPIRAEVWDTNPLSPTYYDPIRPQDSTYGAVPYFISSQYITTLQQAKDAAAANLQKVMGIIQNIDFTGIHNPAHESGDIITVGRDRLSVQGTYVLEKIKFGFGDQVSLAGTTRQQRVYS